MKSKDKTEEYGNPNGFRCFGLNPERKHVGVTSNTENIICFYGTNEVKNSSDVKNCKDCGHKIINSMINLCELCFYVDMIINERKRWISYSPFLNDIEKYLTKRSSSSGHEIPEFHWFILNNVKCGIINFNYYMQQLYRKEISTPIREDIEGLGIYLKTKMENENILIFLEINISYITPHNKPIDLRKIHPDQVGQYFVPHTPEEPGTLGPGIRKTNNV